MMVNHGGTAAGGDEDGDGPGAAVSAGTAGVADAGAAETIGNSPTSKGDML